MRSLAHGLAVALAVTLLACGGGEPAEDAGDIEQSGQTGDTLAPSETPDVAPEESGGEASGPAVFAANCATCHGETGRGDGPAAIGLEPPPADMTDDTWVTGDGSLAAIKNVIENGSPGTAMIGWKGTLSDAEIDAAARHVQSLSQ